MPRGVYERKSSTKSYDKLVDVKVKYDHLTNETDAEIEARLSERFEILDVLAEACTCGNSRALIVSGPAGLGKSYTVEERLSTWDPSGDNYTIVKGYVRATGLVKLLNQYKDEGKVIVFDDADAIFFDDVSLNLLKAVCDTTERRVVSWMSEGKLVDDETGMLVPRTFEFKGTIIFISNYDFDAMIDKGHKLAPHLKALVSRAHYIDLAMKSRRDYIIRIKQVIKQGLLDDLSVAERSDVMSFIDKNSESLRELSLRMALKLGALRRQGSNWERIARITCCK